MKKKNCWKTAVYFFFLTLWASHLCSRSIWIWETAHLHPRPPKNTHKTKKKQKSDSGSGQRLKKKEQFGWRRWQKIYPWERSEFSESGGRESPRKVSFPNKASRVCRWQTLFSVKYARARVLSFEANPSEFHSADGYWRGGRRGCRETETFNEERLPQSKQIIYG